MTEINLNFDYPEFILPAIEDKSHFVVVPAGRQIGKTYNFAQWLIEETMTLGCPSLWVDTVHTNIDKYVERYFRPMLKPVLLYCDWNAQKKILKLPRGYIDFGSSQKPENLEGFNYKRSVLNEAGHILKKQSLWHNTIMPMIKAEDNRTRIIGCLTKDNYIFEKGIGIHKIGNFPCGYNYSYGELYGDGGYHKYIQKYGNGEYKTIKIVDNLGYTIEGTPNHKIFTTSGWKRLDEISLNDKLYIQVGQNVWGSKTEEDWFCYFLGLYLAEGSIEENIYRITITNQDKEVIDFLHDHGFKTCKDGIHHRINSKTFCERWGKYYDKKLAKKKIIPDTILRLNKKCLAIFLSGYFDGDGHSDKHRARIGCNSSSEEIIKTIQILLLNFGIVSSTYSYITKPTRKVIKECIGYRLEINGTSAAKIFYKEIGFRIKRKQDNIANCTRNSSYTVWNTFDWSEQLPSRFCSIRKNEKIQWRTLKTLGINTDKIGTSVKRIEYGYGYTSDYVIPETNQYCANGFISHNTPKGQNLFYELFLRGMGKDHEYASYRYSVYDSPYWTKEQIEEVRKKTPELIWKQEYMASFEAFAGMIYPDFKEEIHCKSAPDRKVTDIFFVVLDPGWEHPTACILAKEDLEGNIFVIDEFRESYLHAGDITRYLNSLLVRNGLKEENIEMFIMDPAGKKTDQTSGQSIVFQLREEGWPFIEANNDVMAGISRVTRMIRENKLFIDKNRCPKLVEEVKNYHWKEFSDGSYGMNPSPYKIGDDLIDTVRYLCMARPDYFEHPKTNMYGQVVKDEEPDIEDYDINESIDEMMSGDSII